MTRSQRALSFDDFRRMNSLYGRSPELKSRILRKLGGFALAFDELEFNKIYEKYFEFVLNYLKRKNCDQSSEIANEVFSVLFMRWDTFLSHPNQEAWLVMTAKNLMYKGERFLTQQKRDKNETLSLSDQLFEPGHNEPGPERELLSKEQLKGVYEFLKSLPVRDQQIFQAVFIQGHDQQRVADMFGMPLGTLKSRLNHIRGQIKNWVLQDKANSAKDKGNQP